MKETIITLYSLYKNKKEDIDRRRQIIVEDDDQFPLLAEEIGKLIIRQDTSKDYYAVLYKHTYHKFPTKIGYVKKEDLSI